MMLMEKRKKPSFHRQNSHRKERVSDSWRRPRGIDSKQALKKKYMGARPTPGYGQPKKVRGKHPSGLEDVLVHNPKELEGLDKEKHAVRIAHTVGKKKRLEIIKQAEEMGLKILNKGVA